MSVFDSEQILEQAAALAEPASDILHRFVNNAVGDDPIVTDNGVIPSLADLIKSIIDNVTDHGGGKYFDNKEDGIANTLDRQFFIVFENSLYKMYYKNGSVATLVGVISNENYSTNEKTKLADLPTNDALTQILDGLSDQFNTFEQQFQGELDDLNASLLLSIQDLQNSKAQKGNNSDITQLNGLTTALTIEQGGTGSKTISDARAALFPACRNRIINGSCLIQQRGPSNISVVAGASKIFGIVDRFWTRNTNVTGVTQNFGIANITHGGINKPVVSLQIATSSSPVLTGTNLLNGICQSIEGYNIADLRGKPVTVSFLFAASVAGTYSVSLRTGPNLTKSFVTTITVPSNGVQRIVIQVPALPNSDADIPYSNSTGLEICIGALNTGTYQSTTGNLNTWQTGNFLTAPANTNYATTVGAAISLTELQLEEGTAASVFEVRPINEITAQCQRYFEIMNTTVTSSQGTYNHRYFKVTKRTTPSISVRSKNHSSTADFSNANGGPNSFCYPYTTTGGIGENETIFNIDAEL